jgi:hypothetical protein
MRRIRNPKYIFDLSYGNTFSQELSRDESPYNEDLPGKEIQTIGNITII